MVHEPHEPHERWVHGSEFFRIQGAVFEVNRVMGIGFLEAVYQECLAIEFRERGIPFAAMPRLKLDYKGAGSGNITHQILSASIVCWSS
jgi:GxxExxY protein